MPLSKFELERMIGDEDLGPYPPHCLACGYDLTGCPSPRCPECGNVFVRKEWKRQATAIRQRVRQAEASAEWSTAALLVGGAGLVFRAGGLAFGVASFEAWAGRGMALLLGFIGFFLALAVFRAWQLPAWARELVADAPRLGVALGASILGSLLMLSVLSPW